MFKRWSVPGLVVCCLLLVGCAPAAPSAPVGSPAGPVPGVSPATVPAPPNGLAPSPVSSPSPSPSPLAAAAPAPTTVPRSGNDRELILATTTSTQDSGLLKVLVPMFEQASGYQVKTISV